MGIIFIHESLWGLPTACPLSIETKFAQKFCIKISHRWLVYNSGSFADGTQFFPFNSTHTHTHLKLIKLEFNFQLFRDVHVSFKKRLRRTYLMPLLLEWHGAAHLDHKIKILGRYHACLPTFHRQLGCAVQMSNGRPFSLLNNEQTSNKVGVEHHFQWVRVLSLITGRGHGITLEEPDSKMELTAL